MPEADPTSSRNLRAPAVTRAQWAVLQTGLITSGLVLFGVYVLATRINDLHLMGLYYPKWLPLGPLVAGIVAGSGYVIAAVWFGVRVTVRMLLVMLLLQVGTFAACHYADFETLDLVYRETNERVPFGTYFHYITVRLGAGDRPVTQAPPAPGYAIRAVELLLFCAGAAVSTLGLFGRPRCASCGGLLRRHRLATFTAPLAPDLSKRLDARARAGDVKAFREIIAAHEVPPTAAPAADGATAGTAGTADTATSRQRPAHVELRLSRCVVCESAFVQQVPGTPNGRAAAADHEDVAVPRLDVGPDFARALSDASAARGSRLA